MLWTLIVPVKADAPKSRLASTLAADAPASLHAQIVAAMRTDALAAAAATRQVRHIVVVADRAEVYPVDVVLVQARPGLNNALREGFGYARRHWPDDGIAALVGDLPALRPDDLGAALDRAAQHAAAFVPDAEGTGTTLLAGRPGTRLQPQFGTGSAARHARQAAAITNAAPGLRRDVDTADELRAALELGVGPATCAAGCVMLGSP